MNTVQIIIYSITGLAFLLTIGYETWLVQQLKIRNNVPVILRRQDRLKLIAAPTGSIIVLTIIWQLITNWSIVIAGALVSMILIIVVSSVFVPKAFKFQKISGLIFWGWLRFALIISTVVLLLLSVR